MSPSVYQSVGQYVIQLVCHNFLKEQEVTLPFSIAFVLYRQVSKLPKSQREQFYKLTRKKGLLEVSDNLLKSAGRDF